MIIESYHNFYEFIGRMEKDKINRNFGNATLLLALALILIFCYTILIKNAPNIVWADVALEGLHIGGWVFMWEALHIASFGSRDLFRRRKEIKRLLKSDITFQYKACYN